MDRVKVKCDKCGGFYSSHVVARHSSVCTGKITNIPKKNECPFCGEDVSKLTGASKANHIRWCKNNPKRSEYIQAVSKRMKDNNPAHLPLSMGTRKKMSDGVKKAHLEGKYNTEKVKYRREHPIWLGRFHTEETKIKQRESALKCTHRRLRKSTRIYTKIDGEPVLLDSLWEEILAKRLDDIGVRWCRPNYIEYELEGTKHKYFPDFYLEDYDLYLDPKNPYALKVQLKKIEVLKKRLPNLIILTTIQECEFFEIPCRGQNVI